MASIEKRGSRWRARIRRAGVEESKSFRTRAEAEAWARHKEVAINERASGLIPSDKTFGDLLERYIAEVLPANDGHRPERLRLHKLLYGSERSGIAPDPLRLVPLADLDARHVAEWRDRRLRSVSAASVRREWNTLSSACGRAVKEWRWLLANPFQSAKRPDEPRARSRRITDAEVDMLLLSSGYRADVQPRTLTERCGAALLWALETAMRAGEICALRWADVDRQRRIAHVRAVDAGARKTGHARQVPLSSAAMRLLDQMAGIDNERVFGLTAMQLSTLFRNIKNRTPLDDLHFHDTRREALTRLAAKVDVMTLAKISGHRDLKILLNTYYAPDMSSVAEMLD